MLYTVITIILLVIIGTALTCIVIINTDEMVSTICSTLIWVIIGLISVALIKSKYDSTLTEKNIAFALNKNYTGYTDYHHNNNENSFSYSGKKYNFDYDYDTNTLTVFDETVIDGTYINGQRQNVENEIESTEIVSETTSESEAADTSVDTDKADSTPVSESNSDLNRRIQSTILEKYMDATITSYDASNLSGTFETDGGSYKFSYSGDLLEITEVDNPNNVIFMKIQK